MNHYNAVSALSVLAVAGTLSACSVGHPYERPDVPVATQWLTTDEGQRATSPHEEWWHSFGSPDLDALIAEARTANLDLRAAVARMREADAQVRIAGGDLLPALDLSGSLHRERQPVQGSSSRGSEGVSSLQTVSLTASYEVDFWGRNRAAVESVRASALASRYDRDTVDLSLVSSVASTYFQIISLHDRLDATRDSLANATRVLRALHARLDAGIATALDIAQQETVVATLDASLPPLETALRQNINALAILLGRLPEAFDLTIGTLADITPPEIMPGLPSELLKRRPDIAAAEAGLAAANADITAARAAFFPAVQLTAQGGIESAAFASLIGPARTLYTLAAGLTQPLFEGGRLKGQYHLAESRYDEQVQNYRKAVLSAFGDVEDSLTANHQAVEQERHQQDAVEAARRANAIATAELNAGTVDVLTVLQTQNALVSAEDTLIQVKLARLQATVGLFRALGGGWRQPGASS